MPAFEVPEEDAFRQPAEDAPVGVDPVDGYHHPGFAWLDRMGCKDRELGEYFAQAGHVLGDEQKDTCMRCPVMVECLVHSYLGGGNGKPLTGGYMATLSPGQRKKYSLSQAMAKVKRDREKYFADRGEADPHAA